MEKAKMTIKDMEALGNYEPLNQGAYDINRAIKGQTIARKNLQLAGHTNNVKFYSGYLLGWGTNEYNYLKKLDADVIKQKLANVINMKTPGIILSQGFRRGHVLDVLIEIAETCRVPVYKLDMHMANIVVWFHELINNYTKYVEVVHASFVVINDVGVLITGRSGIGKSESVLEIIQRNHIFVGDDSIEIYKSGNHIYGRSSRITKDLLEIRGIGLLNIPFIYGKRAVVNVARVDLVVELVAENHDIAFDRLGVNNLIEKLLDKEIAKTLIPIKVGRTISALIIAAASVHAAKKEGMDPLKTIKLRREW